LNFTAFKNLGVWYVEVAYADLPAKKWLATAS